MKTNQRRKALVKIIGASGAAIGAANVVPKSWQSPVVQSVLLPAHAVTSEVATGGNSGPGQPSPFAGTYNISQDNAGTFTGNCANASTFIPANTNLVVNMDGSIVIFGIQFDSIVQPDGTIDTTVMFRNPAVNDQVCTVTNSAVGSIVGTSIMGSLTSNQTCEDGCTIQVSTGFAGSRV